MDLRLTGNHNRKFMQLLYLMAAVVVLFPFEIVSIFTDGFGYFLAEKYMAVPCLLFLGSALTQPLSRSAKWSLGLSAAAVLWFVVVQLQHHFSGMDTRYLGITCVGYLLAFPFASVTDDGERSTGLRWAAWVYVVVSLVFTLLTGLLLLDAVPQFLRSGITWDGARALIFFHPNGVGCTLMSGIGFSLYLLTQTKTRRCKLLWAVLVTLEFGALMLTNSRTSIFLTCALIGGTLFFHFWKGGWKQFLLWAAAAVTVMVALAALQSVTYEFHTQAQIDKLIAQQTRQAEALPAATQTDTPDAHAATEPAATEKPGNLLGSQHLNIDQNTGEVTLNGAGSSNQNHLLTDIHHFNGRTNIWKAAFQTLEDNPSLKLWGTENVAAEISYRNNFSVINAHNSWVQILMLQGVPGLLIALVYTLIALWSLWMVMWRKGEDLGRKVVAMLALCILIASMLETYLFVGEVYTNFANVLFFLSTGYLTQWNLRTTSE